MGNHNKYEKDATAECSTKCLRCLHISAKNMGMRHDESHSIRRIL